MFHKIFSTLGFHGQSPFKQQYTLHLLSPYQWQLFSALKIEKSIKSGIPKYLCFIIIILILCQKGGDVELCARDENKWLFRPFPPTLTLTPHTFIIQGPVSIHSTLKPFNLLFFIQLGFNTHLKFSHSYNDTHGNLSTDYSLTVGYLFFYFIDF